MPADELLQGRRVAGLEAEERRWDGDVLAEQADDRLQGGFHLVAVICDEAQDLFRGIAEVPEAQI